jgi:hypothetical protein
MNTSFTASTHYRATFVSYAAGNYDRLSGLATELVRANVDVIVVDGTAAARACKSATTTIPIVFALAVDPVADGLAVSFARPDGNLTGLTMAAGYALAGKRVELLKAMFGGPCPRFSFWRRTPRGWKFPHETQMKPFFASTKPDSAIRF